MVAATSTSETLVNFYQTSRPNNPEDSHLSTRRRENLITQFYYLLFTFHKLSDSCLEVDYTHVV
jgi:hypothetical protein